MGLYQKHRPKKFEDLIGQPEVIKVLTGLVKNKGIPHALMLSGPSGTGKTTAAKILRKHLGCDPKDFYDINAADSRGIDTIREIRSMMPLSATNKSRIWLIDEAGKLTNDAQTALLKILEDTPKHVYFMLATTDPGKLIKTIHTRCTEIKFKNISLENLKGLVAKVADKEKVKISEDVLCKIAECAEGSARKALVFLEQVMGIEDEEQQLEVIKPSKLIRQAFDIVKALLWEKQTWQNMAKILKEVDTSDPEGLRHLILACANTEMLKGGKNSIRAAAVADAFSGHWYDCKETGLTLSCFQILGNK